MQILYKTVQFHFSRDMCRLAVDCVYVKYIVRENPKFHGLIVVQQPSLTSSKLSTLPRNYTNLVFVTAIPLSNSQDSRCS
jgi:hypothetical protein